MQCSIRAELRAPACRGIARSSNMISGFSWRAILTASVAVASFANNFQIGFSLQQPTQAIAENRMVIGDHKAYRVRSSKIHASLPVFAGQ